jgi:hypothetical protein
MLEILQILLHKSCKMLCHQSQKNVTLSYLLLRQFINILQSNLL